MKSAALARCLVTCAIACAPSVLVAQSGKLVPLYAPLPPGMTRLTTFGERADWSPDGKRLVFLEKTFGDVYEVDVATRALTPLTHHYFHEGYTRALHLPSGDILLSGAPEFDAKRPWRSRNETAELWVLSRKLDGPPVPLGTRCSEGPAVSRTRLRIAWTIDHGDYPDKLPEGVSQMWVGDIETEAGKPRLVNRRKVLDSRDLQFKCSLETQDFRPPDEKELTFSAYGHQGTEVMGVDLETGKVTNYSNAPGQYDEPEGIFPDGKHTLVECDRHSGKGSGHIDVYKLALDGSGKTERLTSFNDQPTYKASNPVVSPDGRWIAFQEARSNEAAGIGHGILVLSLEGQRP
ncbi:MAG: PD40 domain-containing protein [Planctomycetes bacterium]|nr:PD40 domain-containing protein [Planctomycetota bacterium]